MQSSNFLCMLLAIDVRAAAEPPRYFTGFIT